MAVDGSGDADDGDNAAASRGDADDDALGAAGDDDAAAVPAAPFPKGTFVSKTTMPLYAAVFQPFMDGAADFARYTSLLFFFEDLGFAALEGFLGGIVPQVTAHCTAVSVGLILLALLHGIYIVAARPFDSRVDTGFALANAALVATVGLSSVAALHRQTISNEEKESILEKIIYAQTALFVLQPIAALVVTLRSGRGLRVFGFTVTRPKTSAPSDDDNDVEMSLLQVPAMDDGDADQAPPRHNPLDAAATQDTVTQPVQPNLSDGNDVPVSQLQGPATDSGDGDQAPPRHNPLDAAASA